jgi:hypothetical protein
MIGAAFVTGMVVAIVQLIELPPAAAQKIARAYASFYSEFVSNILLNPWFLPSLQPSYCLKG